MSFWTFFNLFPDPPPIPERRPTEHKPTEWKIEYYSPEPRTITITPEKIELVEKEEDDD